MNRFGAIVAIALGLVVVVGCGGGSGSGAGPGRYVVADAGPVDTAGVGYQAVAGPNEAGQLVAPTGGLGCGDGGNVNGCFNESPYVYTPGGPPKTIQPMGTLQGINGHGDVIGFDVDGISFIIRGGNKTSLGTLGGSNSQAFGLNDAGQVVGSSLVNNSGSSIHAFLWQAGRMVDIGGLPGFRTAEAFGINQAGQIVGGSDVNGAIRATYWHDGVAEDISAQTGAPSQAYAINNAGLIVGWSRYFDGRHAFAWLNGSAVDLGQGEANGVDGAGNIVGATRHPTDSSGSHAVIWVGGNPVDLNTQIDPSSGWVLQCASGINSTGQIAGAGTHNGVERAFLLTPRSGR
jgi:probable HAF family extracellular repeat protein